MKAFIKKHFENGVVSVAISLVNLGITLTTITVLSYYSHWDYVFAPTVYYLVAQFFSANWSALFGRGTDMQFTLPKWLGGKTYHYSKRSGG